MNVIPFHPTAGATKNLAVTAASANLNLIVGGAAGGPIQVRVHNSGNNIAFIRQGADNTVVATTTADVPIPPGDVEVFTFNVPVSSNGGLWIAAISSSTTTLYFSPGAGL